MPEVHTTQRAEIDLAGIWHYVADDNLDAADELLRRFRKRSLSYAHQPALGEARTELGRELNWGAMFVVSLLDIMLSTTSP